MSRIRTFLSCAILAAGGLVNTTGNTAENPVPDRFETSLQKKSMSVAHWQAIASDMADSVLKDLKEKDSEIYVSAQEGSVFTQHLSVFMKDALLAKGGTVLERPQKGALTLNVNSSFVAHESAPAQSPRLKWTALTTGVAVLREIAKANPVVGLVSTALALDAASAVNAESPRAEVTVFSNVTKDGKYLSRQSNVYYVDGLDGELFGGTAADPPPHPDYKWFKIQSN